MKFWLVFAVVGCVMLAPNAATAPKRNVTVEVSLITDLALFTKWNLFYNMNMKEAVEGIYHMYANVYKTVRERFWGVKMEGVRFNLRVANTHVAFTEKMDIFIEEGKEVKIVNGTITEAEAMEAVAKFVRESKTLTDPWTKWNSSDVNILVTGYKFRSGKDSFADGSLLNKNVVNMVITEVGMHKTADILTRKLTEVLGGQVDVTDNEGHLMTADRSASTFEGNNYVDNLDTFSTETLTNFEITFGTKIFDWDQVNPSKDKTDVDLLARTKPIGLTYPAHRQCKFIYGQAATDCQDNSALDLCIRLGCTVRSTRECTFSGDQRAYDRTACGEGKWCLKGKCVRDDDAPPNKEYSYTKYE